MLWFYLALIATILWSITNIVDKFVTSRKLNIPTYIFIISVVGVIIAIILSGFKEIIFPPIILLLLALFSGIIWIAAFGIYLKAVQIEEISRVIPIILTIPIFVLIFATIFLNEVFGFWNYIGIFLLVAGSILISIKKTAKIHLSKAFWFAILASILYAGMDVILKYLLGFMDNWNVFFWMKMGVLITAITVFAFKRKQIIDTLKSYGKPALFGSISEAVSCVAEIILILAFALGTVTLATAVNSIQPFFVLVFALILSVFAPHILKEELKGSIIVLKIIAIIILFIGSILIL